MKSDEIYEINVYQQGYSILGAKRKVEIAYNIYHPALQTHKLVGHTNIGTLMP